MLGISHYSALFFLHVFVTLLPVLRPPCQIVYYQLYLRGAKARSLVWKQRIRCNSFVLWRCSSLHIEIYDFYATLYMSSMSAKKKKSRATYAKREKRKEQKQRMRKTVCTGESKPVITSRLALACCKFPFCSFCHGEKYVAMEAHSM